MTLNKKRIITLKALSLNKKYEQEKLIATVTGASDVTLVSSSLKSNGDVINQSGNFGIGVIKGGSISGNVTIAGVINQVNGKTVSTSNSISPTGNGQFTYSNGVTVTLSEGTLDYTGNGYFHEFLVTPDSLVYAHKLWEIHQIWHDLYGLFQPNFGDNCFLVSSSVKSLMDKRDFSLVDFELRTKNAIIQLKDYQLTPPLYGFYLTEDGKNGLLSKETAIVCIALDPDNGVIEISLPSYKLAKLFNYSEQSKVMEILTDFTNNDFSLFGRQEGLIRENIKAGVKLIIKV